MVLATSASAPHLLGPASPSPPPPPPPSSLTRTVKWESAPRLLHNSYQLQETPTSPAASESAEPPPHQASLKPQESSMSKAPAPRHLQMGLILQPAATPW